MNDERAPRGSENGALFVGELVRSRVAGCTKEVFSQRDLEGILGLRTEPFSKMPRGPVKVGEATFSEVYSVGDAIYKVIPIDGDSEMASFCREVFVLESLRGESGVCRILDRYLVRGPYTVEYVRAWEKYGYTENAHPSEHSLFGVIAMDNCGVDLEKHTFSEYGHIVEFLERLLWIIHTLEKKYGFEHRDMHWGNIMIKGAEVFLIDFNLARIETSKILYTDLRAYRWLFEGDPSVDPQFEVYRRMRRLARSNWMAFEKRSNLLWIEYVIDKMYLKVKDLDVKERFRAARMLQQAESAAKACSDTEELYLWLKEFVRKSSVG